MVAAHDHAEQASRKRAADAELHQICRMGRPHRPGDAVLFHSWTFRYFRDRKMNPADRA
ncbi:hypothetical protein I546_1609 [Mycobacterium kansasii 732]|nr:hypothetical protein I546_1609 [Mycobacterium kansasii 732]